MAASTQRAIRLSSPAFARNIGPITDALRAHVAESRGLAVEIGCGPGEHAVALARAFPGLDWLPTDPDADALASVAERRSEAGPNLLAPRRADAAEDWPATLGLAPGAAALTLAVNVIHIAPWAVAEGLIAGAGRALQAGGVLALYGPFFETDREPAPSNLSFDRSLRARDASWGVRHLAEVDALARAEGFGGLSVTRLPANNLLAAWRR